MKNTCLKRRGYQAYTEQINGISVYASALGKINNKRIHQLAEACFQGGMDYVNK